MTDWKEYRLIDVLDALIDYRGKTPKKTTAGVPLITAKIIKNGRIETPTEFISIDDYDSWMVRGFPKVGDVVLTTEAPLGEVAQLDDENIALAQRVVTLRGKAGVLDNSYLKYYFMSNVGQQRLKARETGTTVTGIKQSELREVLVNVPPYKSQLGIASILKSLDDKIECNRRINENLEQQAQALFKSWFVDFEPFKDQPFAESELGMIPQGWKVLSLEEMTSKFGTGLNPRQNFKLGEGDNYYVTIKNMRDNRVYLDDRCDKVTDEAIEKINRRSKLKKGDLLFSGIGTIGRVAMVTATPINWNTSESVFNLHPEEGYSSEFLYVLLLSDIFQQYVKLHAQGGVQQGIRMASLKQYLIALPESTKLKEFDEKLIPIVSIIRNNENEIDRLAELRDALLPKLMSGEIDVNDIKL